MAICEPSVLLHSWDGAAAFVAWQLHVEDSRKDLLIQSDRSEGVNPPLLKGKSVNKMFSISSLGVLFFTQHVHQKDIICHTCMSKHTGETHPTTAALKALGQSQGPTASTMMQKTAYKTAPEASFKKVNKQDLKDKFCCIIFLRYG